MFGVTERAALRLGWNALGCLVLISWNGAAGILIFGILKGSITQEGGGALWDISKNPFKFQMYALICNDFNF